MGKTLCPCGSRRNFDKCCSRFLDGNELPKLPEQLMRSRYTAHVLVGEGKRTYAEYLVGTWLAAQELGLTAESFGEHTVNWQKLEILHAKQDGVQGEVEFKAYFYNKTPANNELQVHHERSLFKRIKGVWYYVEAIDIAGME